ncbi:MAG: hypothetical protein K1X88_01785 [Nannocystaceae bacterium]|nr:hypothetical protein [Nannocystaceae bacterium]
MLAVLAGAVPLAALANPAVAAEPAAAVTEAATARVILRTTAVAVGELERELHARWPDAELQTYGSAAFTRFAGTPHVYVEVLGEAVGDSPIAITLITSDGRAYVRQVVVGAAAGARARVLAVEVANLLAAVTDEDVPPDRTDVAMPTPQVPRQGPPPAAVVITRRPHDPVPPPRVTVTPPPRDEPTPPLHEPRVWQLGPAADASLLLGVAPVGRRGRPGFGGRVGIDARAPVGVAFGAAVRLVGDSALAYRLVRTRIDVHAGWIGRRGQLEGGVLLAPTLEPWRVRGHGRGLDLGSRRGAGWTVLYGAALRGVIGYAWRVPDRPLRLRLGLGAELAGSALASGRAVRVWLAQLSAPLFALGGFELSVGIDAAIWFDLPAPRRGPRSRSAAAAAARAPARGAGPRR